MHTVMTAAIPQSVSSEPRRAMRLCDSVSTGLEFAVAASAAKAAAVESLDVMVKL